ncbi:CapA family protein [Glutamicibacter halophytocola]|uniref:CapA family protein n=1 Tax=Glutamicibacter halophytocola TaxID=1933880 RepID=A0AA94XRT3_9MICC|nr:CapA family protein [Glutamicibacter halophytocola]UUX57451.1 CapA family protein [Glutamicibacter halophytocola]
MHSRLPLACRSLTVGVLLSALLAGCSASVEPDEAPRPSKPALASTPAPESSATSEPKEFSLMVTGDVLVHPPLLEQARSAAKSGNGKDYDFSALLAGLKPYANDADAALCNLETPIGTPPYSGYPRFTVPAQILSDLKSIGYDGCTTATNHTVDAGTSGVNRTLDALEEQELFATGSYRSKKEAQEPPIIQIDGIKLGVIASTFSLNGLPEAADWQVDTGVDAQKLIQRGKSARQDGADVVVAAIHDGTEYSNRPTAQQRKLGRELAESGVFDFIYMHHTHSALPIEKHDGTWIVYGLGNSVAKHATKTILNREGISVKATFSHDEKSGDWKVSQLQWVPHMLSQSPVAWCQVFEASACLPEADAKSSLARTTATVNAYGAFDDGLEDWKIE